MRRVTRIFIHHKIFCLLLLLFFLPGGSAAQSAFGRAARAPGKTLPDYTERVGMAKSDLSMIYSLTEDDFDEGFTRQDQAEMERNFFSDVVVYLPPKETIEWQGMEIEVDNRWLHARLEDLKKLPITSPDRDPIVNELVERLSAIEAKLQELEAAAAASRNKDEEKQKLAQILNRPEYRAPEKTEKGALERWWEAFSKWISDLFPRPQPLEPLEPIVAPSIIPPGLIQIIVIAGAVAIIVFVIWWFAPFFRNRRRRKKEKKDSGERIILGERLAADESSASLFAQAESMARDGNFRGAIRKGYIALLCELGDRKIVRLAQHKTNRDYLRDVSKHRELHHGVGQLTSIFETHWYGLSSASAEDWGAFRENYPYGTNKP